MVTVRFLSDKADVVLGSNLAIQPKFDLRKICCIIVTGTNIGLMHEAQHEIIHANVNFFNRLSENIRLAAPNWCIGFVIQKKSIS